MDELREHLGPQVRTMQIVVAGLTVSPVVFAVIVLVIRFTPLEPNSANLLTKICLVIGLAGLAAHRPLGRFVLGQSLKAISDRLDDPSALGGAYMSSLLVSLSMTEGAAFINLLGFMAARDPLCMAMAALLVLVNLTRFPTLEGVVEWAEAEMARG